MEGQQLKLNVFLWGTRIGVLEWNRPEGRASFQFSDEYLESDIDLSPITYAKEKVRGRAFWGNRADKYQGLPEFLADSLPDKWGNTLFDQWLSRNKVPLMDINPLLKLSFIGSRGMGAFEFVPATDLGSEESGLDMGKLYELSLKILSERHSVSISAAEEKTLEKLIVLGTSAGGMHAKGIIAINQSTGEIRSGQIELPTDYRYYIIKFKEDPAVPSSEVEMAYCDMAVAAGIDMMPCSLYEAGGVSHFITERFDRQGGEKILTQTLAAISPSARDYTNLFWIAGRLGLGTGAKEQIFRRMVFNHIAGVTDDHNKNFSFLMTRKGEWSLSPAYDVMFTANIWENASAYVHSLGVGGKTSYVTRADLLEMAEDFEIESGERIIAEVAESVGRFPEFCERYSVGKFWTKKIEDVLHQLFR